MTRARTLNDLFAIYATQYLTNTAPRTQYQRRGLLRRFAEDLGTIPVDCLTPMVVRCYGDHLRRALKPGSVRQYLDTLSAILTVAVEDLGWLQTHPMRHVRKPPPSPGRVRILDADEQARLLAACQASRNAALYPLVLLALSTGCRRGELFGLRWQDVDLERGYVRLGQTKNGERRAVPVPQRILQALRDWRNGQAAMAWVLPRTGTKTDFPGEHSWRQAVKRAALIDFRFHDLRHTFASYLAMSGASPLVIAAILGHKSVTMVKRYSHYQTSYLSEVVERMAQQFLQDER